MATNHLVCPSSESCGDGKRTVGAHITTGTQVPWLKECSRSCREPRVEGVDSKTRGVERGGGSGGSGCGCDNAKAKQADPELRSLFRPSTSLPITPRHSVSFQPRTTHTSALPPVLLVSRNHVAKSSSVGGSGELSGSVSPRLRCSWLIPAK